MRRYSFSITIKFSSSSATAEAGSGFGCEGRLHPSRPTMNHDDHEAEQYSLLTTMRRGFRCAVSTHYRRSLVCTNSQSILLDDGNMMPLNLKILEFYAVVLLLLCVKKVYRNCFLTQERPHSIFVFRMPRTCRTPNRTFFYSRNAAFCPSAICVDE